MRKSWSYGFVDAMMAKLGGPRSKARLEKLDAATPWETLPAPVRRRAEYTNGGAGRPLWDPVPMLRCLMFAKRNNLSARGLGEQLKDRISFRRFVGLSFTDATPHETTFVRFRQRLREAGLHDTTFEAVLGHIRAQGLLVKEMDDGGRDHHRGAAPPSASRRHRTRDRDASFTSKHSVQHRGYKRHIGADLSGIVTRYASSGPPSSTTRITSTRSQRARPRLPWSTACTPRTSGASGCAPAG